MTVHADRHVRRTAGGRTALRRLFEKRYFLLNLQTSQCVYTVKGPFDQSSEERNMRLSLQPAMDRYELSVFRAAYYICKNRQDAEDVCQETFLAYFSEDRDFESPEHIRAWLLRTAINKAKNVCRAFWRRNRESLDDHAEIAAAADSADAGLLDAVLRLPVRCRSVIHLFYYEDLSVSETAELLGISENTVKSQLHRGRKLLKEMLKEGWDDDES